MLDSVVSIQRQKICKYAQTVALYDLCIFNVSLASLLEKIFNGFIF